MKMVKIQSLLCLLTSLTLCVAAEEVTELPYTEAETRITEGYFASSTEPQTQTSEVEISGMTPYESNTQGFFTAETTTQTSDNSTYTVVIEDPEGRVDLGTLIGIVVGIVSVIGVSAMLIILIIRKMGRYSKGTIT